MPTFSELNDEFFAFIREEIRKELSPFRSAHIFAVEKMAVEMGKDLLPCKIPELRAAALFHDITKEKNTAEQLELCRKYGLVLSPEEYRAEKTLHARTGAYYAAERFPELITDEIRNAIYKHTVADADMTVMDKIVYLADLMEETRVYPFCQDLLARYRAGIREELTESGRLRFLDTVFLEALSHSVCELVKSGRTLIPATVAAYNATLLILTAERDS